MASEPILYHIAPSRSSIVLWMLEEVGRPYTLKVLDARAGENQQPAYLAINPMGKVPTLVHEGVVITETGAILCYLADAFPDAGLTVPIADPRRGPYLQWLFFLHSCLEPAVLDRMLERPAAPRRMLGYGDFDATMERVAAALTPGPFLLGEPFTAADVAIGSLLDWGSKMGTIPARPAITAYLQRLAARPAWRRAEARDQALAPAAG